MDQEWLEIKKQMVMEFVNSEGYVPMKIKEIAILLQVPRQKRNELKYVLDELVAEGRLDLSAKGKYMKPEKNYITGIFEGTVRGFGFVTVENEEEDIFIPESGVNGAFHQDRVKVLLNPVKTGKRREGSVIKILERGMPEVVGTFHKNRNFGFVVPDNQKISKDIFVSKGKTKGAVTGHKVVVKILNYGFASKKPEGVVTEILGHINDPGTDILSVIKGYDLPLEFPQEVMEQTEAVSDRVNSKEMAGRLDLRNLKTVTIDGEEAKDLDDAITIEKKEDHYVLGVHIADVSHYVTEGSPLDKEAFKRGTSVYLVDRVIPMLPHKLSNGICSLNEKEDRLALSCIMEVDEKGNITDHKIAETVICVDRRMTYTSVNKILEEQDPEECEKYKELIQEFIWMKELADLLREKRRKKGSIDFDFPESKIVLDDKGFPIEIKPYERNSATNIIEDFMLAANETVAEDYFWQEIPFLYRTHDYPDTDKIKKLAVFINNFGFSIRLNQEEVHPKEIQKLLAKIEDTPQEMMISRLTLRSMKQARYTTSCTGHFGLATQYYCHFTSPIRRYPDLCIHRIIKESLKGGLSEKRREHYENVLPKTAVQSSATERRADEAERETDKLKKVEYMTKRIGDVYEGVISGITSWGIYVELPNTVEGMVHVTNLKDDHYAYHESRYEMQGESTGKVYKLGQRVTVRVIQADKILRTIDFEFIENEE
jgi:ribonuclease R